MNEPRVLETEEQEGLPGTNVQIVAIGSDGIVFRNDSGTLFLTTICLGCGMHIDYYEIDESMLASSGTDPDIAAS